MITGESMTSPRTFSNAGVISGALGASGRWQHRGASTA